MSSKFQALFSVRLLALFCVVYGLSGCAGTQQTETTLIHATDPYKKPVQLGAKKDFVAQNTLRVSVDEKVAKRAIENYRISKKQKTGPYQYSGADLNADGKPELLLYFTGEGWCAATGCTLAILTQSDYGYQTVSTIRRVKAPIFIAETSTGGWRDLYLHTGHGVASQSPQVKLQFTGSGYPGNAITQTVRPKDALTIGEVIIEHRSIQ